MSGALEGIKVLDLTRIYSGPFSSLLLRDLGAEIIKVEIPNSGDMIRVDVPHTVGEESGCFINLNRGKKSITLNLQSEKGRALCKKLAGKVDVLLENFSPGTMDKLGLGSKELCKLYPGLIYASISAYGQTGPRRDFPGFDPIAQAMGGMVAVTGFPDTPVKCGVSVADLSAGTFMTLAITAAVCHKLKTGEGQVVDISMQDCIFQLTSIEFAPHYFLKGAVPKRLGNAHPAMVPANIFPTKDGSVFISAGVLSQLHRLYKAIGREDLINTPMGDNQAVRIKYRDEINKVFTDWAKTKTTKEIMELLKKADVPCTEVPTYEEVCNDPQLISRNMIIEVEQAISGKVKVPGSLFKLSKTPGNITYPAPLLGESNQEIYSELLGLSEDEISQLSVDGII
jgi:crotonobetainyl-CoA:carnitine CoA-transferase CaiB-like acyl-CoA transferase